MPDLTGKILANRYKVVSNLGRGGMAEVYKVYDMQRATHLAIKVLHEDLAYFYAVFNAKHTHWPICSTPISSAFMVWTWTGTPLSS
jgi:serine/threonine protein kinase